MNTRTIAENASFAISEINPLRIAALMVGTAAFAMSFCEVAISHSAAFTLATGETASLLAVIAASAAFVKMLWIPGVTTFWSKRQYTAAFAAVLFGILAHTYSVQAVLSLAATGRDAIISGRGQDIDKRNQVAQRYDAAKQTVGRLAGQRPAAEVERELIAALEQVEDAKRRQSAAQIRETAEKADGLGKRYVAAVAEGDKAGQQIETGRKRVAELNNERKLSVQAEQARAEMQTLSTQLDGLGAPGNADPQAAVMADYLAMFGIKASERSVGLGSILPILALVELGGALSLTIAVALWSCGAPATITQPSGGIAVATWAPTKQLPPPAELSQEEKTFREVRSMVVLSKDNKLIAGSGRKLSKHLEVANATLAQYLNRWEANNRIVTAMENGLLVISLPVRARVAAQREMMTA